MKFFIISLLTTILFLGFSVEKVYSQNETREVFSKVFADYQLKYQEYLSAHDKYDLSKKEYEKYLTLSSKEKLQEDTADMLIKRDGVLVAYYNSIVAKMDDSMIGIPDERKSEYTQKFVDEINWLNDHKMNYLANDSPQTLASKSEEVDTRFTKFKGEVYKSLYYISRGKMQVYGERYNALYNDLFALTERIKIEQRDAYKLSDSKLELIYRWFGEMQVKNEEYTNLLDKADGNVFKATDKTAYSAYTASMKILFSAVDLLKERISYAKEIVNEIKVADN